MSGKKLAIVPKQTGGDPVIHLAIGLVDIMQELRDDQLVIERLKDLGQHDVNSELIDDLGSTISRAQRLADELHQLFA